MQISLFSSAIKPHLWKKLMDSLKSNTIEYEVIFAGPLEESITDMFTSEYPQLKYIKTENIKVAQCYEVARRACNGEIVGWISDDCVFPAGALNKIWSHFDYNYAKSVFAIGNHDPECENNNLNDQRFFSRNLNTPQMANIGFMNRRYLEELGGIDRRYIYGKWECDICMRVLADGGQVVKYEDVVVSINHTNKCGHINNDWSGVNEDGEILDNSWVIGGYTGVPKALFVINDNHTMGAFYPITNQEVTLHRNDCFEPYVDDGTLQTKSQGMNIPGRWV